MSILDISTNQLLDLWAELIEAYHGVNKFGGNTAEIYAYSIMRRDPTADLARASGRAMAKDVLDQERRAKLDLIAVLRLFKSKYECTCRVEVGREDDGLSLDDWELSSDQFHHRTHVRVFPVPALPSPGPREGR